MKKLIAIACFALMGYGAQAQSTSTPAIDTVTDAGTKYLAFPKAFLNANGIWSAGVTITRLTGTAAGYAIIQGSLDGVTYSNLTNTSADSIALTNVASQAKNFYISVPKKVLNARIAVVGSGTQSIQIKGYSLKN